MKRRDLDYLLAALVVLVVGGIIVVAISGIASAKELGLATGLTVIVTALAAKTRSGKPPEEK